jgi:hypothetical protein
MITLKKMLLTLGMFCVLGQQVVHSEIMSGSFTNEFSVGSGLELWDPSGTYTEDLDGLQMTFTLNSDPFGKLTGSGTFNVYEGWDYLSGNFVISGSLKSAGSVVRVKIAMTLTGSGYVAGYFVNFSARVNENLEINAASHEMIGTVGGSITVAVPELRRKQTRSMPKSGIMMDLPDDTDGAWSLLMDVVPGGNTYAGTGTAELSNGRSFDLSVTGSYSAKKDTSKLLLTGLSKAVSLSLVTRETNGIMSIESLKGSTLGQKLKTPR